MKNQRLVRSIGLVLIVLLMISISPVVHAQATVELERLSIDIWPEFDSPATLVIFRGQLADSVELPARLSFQLPSYISEPNAVATINADSGLINNQFTTLQSDGFVQLDFVVDTPGFQFEYYDPEILNSQTSDRRLTFETKSPYSISDLRIELQQPTGATEVKLSPPTDILVGGDTLTYHILEQRNIDPGQIIALSGSYQKDNNRLTVGAVPSQPNLGQELTEVAQTQPFQTAWIFSVGILLLLLAAGLWFFTSRPKLAAVGPKPHKDTTHCTRCGTARRPDAIFCHSCGTVIQDSQAPKN